MRRTSATRTSQLIVCAAAVGLVLQTAASSAQEQENNKKIIVTGCIERLDKTAAAYGAATAAPVDRPSTFALADATVGAVGSSSKVSAIAEVPELDETKPVATAGVGTVGVPSDDSRRTRNVYQLVGDDNLLASHMGHRVEVTGELAARPSSSRPEGGDSVIGTTTEWSALSPKLMVATVKLLSSSCSQ